ncbi:FtsX-like permease family protein [Streptomyces sp. NPDC005576]|uniref:ABC transporter permease n=1 Tax=Streptomyces sp. NPDC005576 TaxID=3364726 RepID=UPI0036C05B16
MRAMVRWARADFRRHRGEALFLVLSTVGIVVSLLLATALFAYATNPWQRVFSQSEGAHVWIRTSASADPRPLAAIDGVTGVSGPYPTESVTLTTHGARASAELRGTTAMPSVGRPLLTAGTWLRATQPDGVVVESGLARALLAGPGDTLDLPGTGRTLTVLGVAESAEPGYSPGERPGAVWALPSAVATPDGQITGLRLRNPGATDYTVQRAVTVLGAGAVDEVTTWQQARTRAQGDNRLLGQVLGLFGLAALVAACFALHGAISTRVRGHLHNISVLKTIGFTPSLVVGAFVLQHLVYALLGATGAALLVTALGDRAPGRLGEAIALWQGLPHSATGLLAVVAGTVVFIGATTALAAWRAGRVPAVPSPRYAAQPGASLSGAARFALGRGLTPALVLGVHRVAARWARSLATSARLALPLLLIVVAMSAWTTIDRLHDHPEQAGRPAALVAHADGLGDAEVRTVLGSDPRVTAVYPGVEMSALVPGQTATIALRGVGTREDPYPFAVAEGRAPRGSHEAVAGQGLFDLLHVRVGDWVRMTVGARPQVLHLVGRSIEPENAGRVVSTSLDNLRADDSGLRPSVYGLRLGADAEPAAVAAHLAGLAGGRLDVYTAANPVAGLSPLREVIAGLIAVLALIGLVELLTSVGAGVREGARDVLVLKAIGLTPRQITASATVATLSTSVAALLAALVCGLPLARWLIDAQGRSTGLGSGLAHLPPAGMLVVFGVTAVAGAAALATLSAAREVRRYRADAVR